MKPEAFREISLRPVAVFLVVCSCWWLIGRITCGLFFLKKILFFFVFFLSRRP